MSLRLRQAVLAAADLDAVAGELREALGLGEPFVDEGVGAFGLRNAVFTLGDQFLEIVSPTQEGTAAGRHLERHGGDSGYMAMFEVDDLDAARERAARAGVRVAWEITLDDIADVHLHPGDMRGAIVAVDQPVPAGEWRWGGPGWRERSAPGRLEAITVGIGEDAAARWREVLGDGAPGVHFVADDAEPGITEIHVAVPGRRGGTAEIGGVTFRFAEEDA